MTDRAIRETALGQLAVKTRERLDPLVISAYLDDERITKVSTADFREACRRLEVAEWFPKFGELVTACREVARERQERDAAHIVRKRIAAYAEVPEVSPEKAKSILAGVFQKISYDPKKGFAK